MEPKISWNETCVVLANQKSGIAAQLPQPPCAALPESKGLIWARQAKTTRTHAGAEEQALKCC